MILSRDDIDNELLAPPATAHDRSGEFSEVQKLVAIADNWNHRAGWHSFVNQVRQALNAEALLIVELGGESGPIGMIAQSLSDACSVYYPPMEIPDFLVEIDALNSPSAANKEFEECFDESFLPFRQLKGEILFDRKQKPIAALIAGYNDPEFLADTSTKGIFTLVASLTTTQIGYEREVAARREFESKLRQTQNLTSVGRLTTGIAHDFNNLLTVIKGHTAILEASVKETDKPKEMESIALIKSASQQAVELTKQLLLFSRQQAVTLERCELNKVVSEFVKMMRRMVEETIDLKVVLGDYLGQIEADRSMLGQVMMNLIVNARDAMPDGGTISIETKSVVLSQKDGSLSPGRYVSLIVRDNGSGVPAEMLPKIFDPFFTTKEKGKGTGLGLANVAATVRKHGGRIDASSVAGEGTCFEVLLPTIKRVASAPTPIDSGLEEESIRGATVLLVEDESAVRKLVRKLLEMHGCNVIEAPSGKQALDMWPEISDQVSVVVTDIVMPEGVSGWDLARKLHASHPDLGVLLTSGYNERPEDHGLGDEKQIAFLQKPYESKNLKHTLFELLQAKSAID